MILTMLKGKIHRATLTGADINYNGSITIDPVLLEAAGILEHEQVDVLDITNGARLTTYAIKSKKPGSGEITINGAAAHLVKPGHLIIVCAYCQLKPKQAQKHQPKVVLVNDKNQVATKDTASRPGKVVVPKAKPAAPAKKPTAKKKK